MRFLHAFLLIGIFSTEAVNAQSTLLESVKRNPDEANALCRKFRNLNKKGISVNSKQVLSDLASEKKLSSIDTEILTTYVVGLYCTDVR